MKKYAVSQLGSGEMPDSLRGKSRVSFANEAMALLGLTDADLEPLSLNHFLKQAQNVEEATRLYQAHNEKRQKYLQDLEAKRKELKTREPPKATRPSGEVIYEQHMINLNNEQASKMEWIVKPHGGCGFLISQNHLLNKC
jgi:hypothetical protein